MTLHQVPLLDFARRQDAQSAHMLRYGELEVDLDRIRVRYRERNVELSAAQFQFLCYAIKRPGKLLKPEKIIADLWSGRGLQHNTLAALVYRLREALETVGGRELIGTVTKKGNLKAYILR